MIFSRYLFLALFIPASTLGSPEADLFHRHDQSAYLALRSSSVSSQNEAQNRQRRRRKFTRNKSYNEAKNRLPDDPRGCTLYGAPSSIPDSGLGMYTTVSPSNDEAIGLPEIGISLIDPSIGRALLANYPWSGEQLVGNTLEAKKTEGLIPSLGMLANSHLGLKSCKIDLGKGGSSIFKGFGGGQSRMHWGPIPWEVDEPGRGASSEYYNVYFQVTDAKKLKIPDGMSNGATEIFVDYGEEWFAWRERNGAFSGMIPFEKHFIRADAMIKRFVEENEYLILANILENERDQQRLEKSLQQKENQLLSPMKKDDLKLLNNKYQLLLDESTKEDPKIAYVLPPVDQIHNLIDVGLSTARYSVPNSLQSTSWLDAHGFCMDNMRMGRSTIPQAGMGAFAVRSMPEGSIVATTPVVTLYQDLLKVAKESKNRDVNDLQLLINYCFGHPNTTLLMFPYSSTIHFINHGATNTNDQAGNDSTSTNAMLRWSHSEYHASELLEKSLQEMQELQKTGLMIDIVATRNISIGEEILIDYGNDWVEKWDEHLVHWEECSNDNVPSPSALMRLNNDQSSILRTRSEQNSMPYPSHVQTVCYFSKHHDYDDSEGILRWQFTTTTEMYPCSILARESFRNDQSQLDKSDTHLYMVHVIIDDSTDAYVDNVPRYGIFFAEKAYQSNQLLKCGFRRFISLADDMVPESWKKQ